MAHGNGGGEPPRPALSHEGARVVEAYGRYLREQEDLSVPTLRNHLSDLQYRFGYRMADKVPLHRLAQIMGHDSRDATMLYVRGTKANLQAAVEGIAWT